MQAVWWVHTKISAVVPTLSVANWSVVEDQPLGRHLCLVPQCTAVGATMSTYRQQRAVRTGMENLR